ASSPKPGKGAPIPTTFPYRGRRFDATRPSRGLGRVAPSAHSVCEQGAMLTFSLGESFEIIRGTCSAPDAAPKNYSIPADAVIADHFVSSMVCPETVNIAFWWI